MEQRYVATTEAVIPEVGEILYVNAPFDEALQAISGAGAHLASAYDLARAFIHVGSDYSLSKHGSRIREALIYAPEQYPLLLRESPLIKPQLARNATNACRKGNEPYLDVTMVKTFTNQAEEDASKPPQERRVLRFTKTRPYKIPTNRFTDEEVTLFLFKDVAADYGRFLASNGLEKIPVWLADKSYVNQHATPFVRQLWFRRSGFGDISLIRPYIGESLDYSARVRGVSLVSANVARARENAVNAGKSELTYDATEMAGYSTILQGVRRGNIPASELEKVLTFVQGLPVK